MSAEPTTQPTSRQRRIQSALDMGASLVLAMLAWPFPVARANLPVPVHIVSILVFWLIVQVGYFVVAVGWWRATPGMALTGLRLSPDADATTRGQRVKWALAEGPFAIVRVVGGSPTRPTLAEKVSGLTLII